MTVRMTSPSTSNCAASGVRGSSARAAEVIALGVCPRATALSSYKRYSELQMLPNRARSTMLLKAMSGKRTHFDASGSDLGTGLRALALLLPR
jgi:hypothetical protein